MCPAGGSMIVRAHSTRRWLRARAAPVVRVCSWWPHLGSRRPLFGVAFGHPLTAGMCAARLSAVYQSTYCDRCLRSWQARMHPRASVSAPAPQFMAAYTKMSAGIRDSLPPYIGERSLSISLAQPPIPANTPNSSMPKGAPSAGAESSARVAPTPAGHRNQSEDAVRNPKSGTPGRFVVASEEVRQRVWESL